MRELDVMTEAIRNAYGAVAQCSRDARVKGNADGVYDVVTDADFASERTIVDAIRVAFPDDAVISEVQS